MPFSSIVQRSAYCDEKLTALPVERSMFFASCLRSLSFAVIETTLAPAAAKLAMIDWLRSSSGPVMTTASPVSRSR